MEHIHLIGIGGSGLSAIATVLLERGYQVSGSDRQETPLTRHLQESGVRIDYGHRAENIRGADRVVRSSAVTDENVEVQAARAAGIPVLKRADFLQELIAGQLPVAIAGTHGKTTTTAMIAWALTALGADPSYVIGGVSADLGANAHAGQGQFFVIEADEYDRMFLGIRPYLAVVTNIEHDHPDCYPTPEDFYLAFRQFALGMQDDGVLIACGEDHGAARLLEEARQIGLQAVSYGSGAEAYDYCAVRLEPNALGGLTFDVLRQGDVIAAGVDLQVPGEHNVRNALAALCVIDRLGLPVDRAAQALRRFRGAGRRFEIRGEYNGVILIDDYAHHPTEIRATLAAARMRYPDRRLWAVWQPHTYSRTRTLFDQFAAAFDGADGVLVTEVFPAREVAPADGFSARLVADAIARRSENAGKPVLFAVTLKDAVDQLARQVQPGDALLVLSAGDADQITVELSRRLSGSWKV
jgi:UDP-N-acetylmuramate--alanine ligase